MYIRLAYPSKRLSVIEIPFVSNKCSLSVTDSKPCFGQFCAPPAQQYAIKKCLNITNSVPSNITR